MSNDWKRVEGVLDRVLEAPEADREALLETLCVGEPELRREVESLLDSAAAPTGLLDGELGHAVGELVAELESEAGPGEASSGKRIGAWELIEPIGSGGMGRVFLARRADGAFEREVAIKILRWELDDEALRQRFSTERQILSQLDHPGIARLLDGGVTEEGLPYLVMERVEGVPIDHYCREEDLDLEGRLELFSKVAEAVRAAHQGLVVHRDLKPSNILVEADGNPRLLDFGVGKLLGEGDDLTRTGHGPYTASYASPEQLAGKAAGTPSDVYSLGVLLYELLVGELPFEVVEGRPTPGDPRLRGEMPRPPSERLKRATKRSALARAKAVSGNLDAIVGKAMAYAPEDRYGWAGDLLDDLRRHREGLPIAARTMSGWGRGVLFVKRHTAAVATAALIALALAAATLFSMRQAAIAERERSQAEETASFALDLLRLPDPDRSGSTTLSALEILEEGATRAEEVRNVDVRGRLLTVIAQGLGNLEEWDRATELFLSVAELAGYPERRDPRAVESIQRAAMAQVAKGDLERGVPLLEEAEALYRDLNGDLSPEVAKILFERATLLARHTPETDPRRMEAMRLLAQAESVQSQIEPEGSLEWADVLHLKGMQLIAFRLAGIEYGEGDLIEQGLESLYAALEMRRKVAGSKAPIVAIALNDIGTMLDRKGEPEEALPLLEEARQIYLEAGRLDHPHFKSLNANLARTYQRLGRLEEAEAIYREVLERHPEFAFGHYGLALVAKVGGNLELAEAEFVRTLELLPEGSSQYCISEGHLGEVLFLQGRLDEAERTLLSARETCLPMQGPGSPTSARVESNLERIRAAKAG